MIKTTILMEPVGKGRPRTVRIKSGQSVTFTPEKTAHAENLIRDHVARMMEPYPPGTPLRIEATFFRSKPKKPKNKVFPVTKPDWDNYAKLLTDALEKFAYDNDSQIVTAIIKKRYVDPRYVDQRQPRIELAIEEEKEEREDDGF